MALLVHVWLTNHLCARKQYVSFYKLDSSYKKVYSGVLHVTDKYVEFFISLMNTELRKL